MSRKAPRNKGRPPPVEKRSRALAEANVSRPPTGVWSRILARRLRGRLGEEVELTITDNIHTMVSYSRVRGRCRLRLHHMFLQACPRTIDALAAYLDGDSGGSSAIDDFIEAHRHLIRRVPPTVRRQRIHIQPRGWHHDLGRIFDELNARFFDGSVRATISWGNAPRVRRPRRSIKLGSYSEDTRIIRIHPALDHPLVPGLVVDYIVFHEMLHVVEGAQLQDGRRVVHTRRFLERERAFPDLDRARDWERRHIDWLLAWQPRPVRRGRTRA